MLDAVENASSLSFGDFTIDRADERLLGPHGPVKLGNKAFRVLLLLAEQQGRLLTKDALFSSVWDGTIVSESALTSVIKELRRALGDESRTPRYIESVYGRGYRLIPEVRTAAEVPDERAPRRREPPSRPSTPEPSFSVGEHRPPLVLVSSFEDGSVRERFPHCAAELREEVLSGLARFREIQLVADSRSEREAGSDHEPSDRDYHLTATLLPDSKGVKVIARAKRMRDGRVVWAETMALADTGTAGGVEQIVRRIVGAALPAVDDDLFLGLPRDSDDLYDNYLIAKRRSFTAHTFEEAKAAAAALERVIAQRPDFALAYPPLVRLYNIDYGYTGLGSTGQRERARALELAKAGLAADRGNVHAYTVLGFCYLWHSERSLARQCFEQALALNPYNPVRVTECATALMYMGDLPGARNLMDRAGELNPLQDDNYREDSGRLRLIEGNYEGALAALGSIISPSIWAELYIAICELRLNPEVGGTRFRKWRERVEQCWHAPSPPREAEISEWIRFHHPLPAETGEHFLAGVDAALDYVQAASNAVPKPGPE